MSDKSDMAQDKLNKLIHDRSIFEMWLDKHNHVMELMRTVFGFANVLLSSLVLLKVFGMI